MKLYYSPGACSLSPHIVLRESGLPVELVSVDLQTKAMSGGGDYREINPKGYVPLLELDDGQRLSEGPAIVQYLADLVPGRDLAPANGTLARYRLQEWLNFVTSELHKGFSPLFATDLPGEAKRIAAAKLADRYAHVEAHLAGNAWLMGDTFSVADAYLFTVTNWSRYVGFDLSPFPNVRAYMERAEARPAIREALRVEGLRR